MWLLSWCGGGGSGCGGGGRLRKTFWGVGVWVEVFGWRWVGGVVLELRKGDTLDVVEGSESSRQASRVKEASRKSGVGQSAFRI